MTKIDYKMMREIPDNFWGEVALDYEIKQAYKLNKHVRFLKKSTPLWDMSEEECNIIDPLSVPRIPINIVEAVKYAREINNG